MEQGELYYYDVSLVIPAIWKQSIYTYSSSIELRAGQVVLSPFGKTEKLGVVVSKTTKPKFDSKITVPIEDIVLPEEAVSLLTWLSEYYPGTPGVKNQHFLPAFLKKSLPEQKTDKTQATKPSPAPIPLTKVQHSAMDEVISTEAPVILHGVTGSGKTRLYAELALRQLKEHRNVLILYPEISLTAQTNKELSKHLGDSTIHVYHSNRTPAQQRKTWLSALNNTSPTVTIGPRSALFLPHQDLGLIIIDEAHDGAYKQDSGTRYSALSVAGKLSQLHKTKLILGSATPPVQETHQIIAKGGKLVCMHETAISKDTHGDVRFSIVDMSDKKNVSGSYLLSKKLIESIKASLENKGQSLVFLNRRGTARMLLCEKCSWHAECEKCDSPLTYHHDTHNLQCHICGNSQKTPHSCPECSSNLTQRTPGTKAINVELSKLFPQAKISRFDSDNKKSESFAENYQSIKDGEVDIIIGTQLITKGLDLPKLDTVGILQAESALYLPDYSSEERAFQQLTQVSGRVGRGHRHGDVIIQAYSPANPIMEFVKTQNWHDFYDQELQKRKDAGYPPYKFTCKIWVARSSREKAQVDIQKVYDSIDGNKIQLLGPAPSFYEKNSGKYNWQIVIKSPSRATLVRAVNNLPKDTYYDLDPASLL
ncbi:MAG: primosomal protein N' (replication factor Y) [Candidatus Saccharimonadales bacterium]|jgi:primosomal protein N' (replication factor Y)